MMIFAVWKCLPCVGSVEHRLWSRRSQKATDLSLATQFLRARWGDASGQPEPRGSNENPLHSPVGAKRKKKKIERAGEEGKKKERKKKKGLHSHIWKQPVVFLERFVRIGHVYTHPELNETQSEWRRSLQCKIDWGCEHCTLSSLYECVVVQFNLFLIIIFFYCSFFFFNSFARVLDLFVSLSDSFGCWN